MTFPAPRQEENKGWERENLICSLIPYSNSDIPIPTPYLQDITQCRAISFLPSLPRSMCIGRQMREWRLVDTHKCPFSRVKNLTFKYLPFKSQLHLPPCPLATFSTPPVAHKYPPFPFPCPPPTLLTSLSPFKFPFFCFTPHFCPIDIESVSPELKRTRIK